MVVRFPPIEGTDAEGWARSLLTDLAGRSDLAIELLEAVWDVESGRVEEWTMNYYVFGVKLRPVGARITFLGDSSAVPLRDLAAVVIEHLRW